MQKKILLTGANGMLATEFIKKFDEKYKIFGFDVENLDITKTSQIEKKFFIIQPDLILNLAAYTNVDDAEDVGENINFAVNSDGVKNLAEICGKNNVDFITISTDFVFDGKNEKGYSENDLQNPVNQYGFAKFMGEKNARDFCDNSIIIRTSWLYGGGKKFKNFVNTMLNLGEKIEKGELKELKVISDQFGNPTYCGDLCEGIGKVIDKIENFRGKNLHFTNETSENYEKNGKNVSWFDFVEEIFFQKNLKIGEKFGNLKKIKAESYKRKAKAPQFSMLNNNSEVQIGDWKAGLGRYLEKL